MRRWNKGKQPSFFGISVDAVKWNGGTKEAFQGLVRPVGRMIGTRPRGNFLVKPSESMAPATETPYVEYESVQYLDSRRPSTASGKCKFGGNNDESGKDKFGVI